MKNKNVLLKLLAIKEPLHEEFNFCAFNRGKIKDLRTKRNIPNCGTSGCLIGNLPLFDKKWAFDKVGDLTFLKVSVFSMEISKYFHLPQTLVNIMFYPANKYQINGHYYNSPMSSASLIEVQDYIKTLMEDPNLKEFFNDEDKGNNI